jgi:hypothetical protein
MDILVLRCTERFQAEVVDNQKIDLGQGIQFSVIGVGGLGGMQLTE